MRYRWIDISVGPFLRQAYYATSVIMQPLIRLDICHKHNKFYCNFNVFCSFWSNLYCFKQRKDQKCRNLRDLWVNVHICLKLACVKIISAPYASNFLRTRVKTHSGEKRKQMRPVWLCILWRKQLEDTFENTQCTCVYPIKKMQFQQNVSFCSHFPAV